MQFHEQFLELHRKFYSTKHAFSASSIAFLCYMATDQKRAWVPKDFCEQFGYSYLGARQHIQRLRLEGLCTSDGVITAAGLNAVGYTRQTK